MKKKDEPTLLRVEYLRFDFAITGNFNRERRPRMAYSLDNTEFLKMSINVSANRDDSTYFPNF